MLRRRGWLRRGVCNRLLSMTGGVPPWVSPCAGTTVVWEGRPGMLRRRRWLRVRGVQQTPQHDRVASMWAVGPASPPDCFGFPRNDEGGCVGIGAKRSRVQERFTPHLNLPPSRGRGYAEVCLRGNDGGLRERWSGMLRRRGWVKAGVSDRLLSMTGGRCAWTVDPAPPPDCYAALAMTKEGAWEWEQKRVVSRNGSPPS